MKTWSAMLVTALLAACAISPVAQPDERGDRFFADALFLEPSERISAQDVFALSPEMRRYATEVIGAQGFFKGRQQALLDALYGTGDLKLEYDSETTRTAAQAFAARSGNCLSLVIMTAAFAKEVGLPIEFQKVFIDETWARSGDIYLSIGHVNLTLGRRSYDSGGAYRVGHNTRDSGTVTVDFLPPADTRGMHTQTIDEKTIIGMFMNNRAVEALALGDIDDAYWWAREGVTHAPHYLSIYNTLGAIYVKNGNPKEAEQVLAYVIERDSSNTQAMSNLVHALNAQGRPEDAQRLAARLKKLDPEPAFSHYIRGMAAMKAGDAKGAKEAFAKEVARAPDYHEFHFWLAIAYLNLGEVEPAREHMAIALKNSTTRRDHDLYAAKLERINHQR